MQKKIPTHVETPIHAGNNAQLKKHESRSNHKRHFKMLLNKLFQKRTICEYSKAVNRGKHRIKHQCCKG